MEMLITSHPWLAAAAALVTVVLGELGRRSFRSRITTLSPPTGYFQHTELVSLPLSRLGYSDRAAWLMAEMADLAYYEFERPPAHDQAIASLLAHQGKFTHEEAQAFVTGLWQDATSGGQGEEFLASLLAANGFVLLETFDSADVQGFICRRAAPDEEPFLVVAFRGSEKKVGDWLTNADAKPREIPEIAGAKVHSGFYRSIKRVSEQIRNRIALEDANHPDQKPVTVFFTGHSLGGALALLATALIAPDRRGACYTFGAPRVANYDFFFHLKTPVYRIVNSADIVPRVPPGLISPLIYYVLVGLSNLLRPVPFLSDWVSAAARYVDVLKDYRHHGDQRYLTDIVDGRFQDTRLLVNPPLTDQALWFWKGMLAGITYPVKSHPMSIYRRKLAFLAGERLNMHHPD